MPKKRLVLQATAGINRVESGAIQFPGDWPGLFIRGDHALSIAMSIRTLQKQFSSIAAGSDWAMNRLAELAKLIEDEVDEKRYR